MVSQMPVVVGMVPRKLQHACLVSEESAWYDKRAVHVTSNLVVVWMGVNYFSLVAFYSSMVFWSLVYIVFK